MPACSHCGNNVAYSALSCPRCGNRNPADSGVGALIVLILIIAVIALVIISPGLLFNYLTGRFSDTPDWMAASYEDKATWIGSIVVWCV